MSGEGDVYQQRGNSCLGGGGGGGLRSLHVMIGQLLGSVYSTCMYRWQGNGIGMYCIWLIF